MARLELGQVLAAGRLRLRLIQIRDAKPLERLLRANRQWLEPWEATHPHGASVPLGYAPLKPLLKQLLRQYRAGRGVPLVLLYDGAIIGQLNVSEISRGALCSAQLGYWIATEFAGRGLMPQAVAASIEYLFAEYGLHRVEVCIRHENFASLRVVEKLGLRYEGRRLRYIHIGDKWCDHDVFAITSEECAEGLLQRLRGEKPGDAARLTAAAEAV